MFRREGWRRIRAAIARTARAGNVVIDVIIPVYKGLAADPPLHRQRAAHRPAHGVRDRRRRRREPRRRTSRATWTSSPGTGASRSLRNESNLGFVQLGEPRAWRCIADRDVVLLNSDTEVANDWLDRLRRCAYAHPDVGTVTPFSNNATICSYPFEGWTGGVPGTLGLAALDRLFASTNAGTHRRPADGRRLLHVHPARLPRRRSGCSTRERFGRGYGEENDFCLRAADSRLAQRPRRRRVRLSRRRREFFRTNGSTLTTKAGKTLLHLYPDYPRQVRAYVQHDPAAHAADGGRQRAHRAGRGRAAPRCSPSASRNGR